jgi:hypothetical protein
VDRATIRPSRCVAGEDGGNYLNSPCRSGQIPQMREIVSLYDVMVFSTSPCIVHHGQLLRYCRESFDREVAGIPVSDNDAKPAFRKWANRRPRPH